MQGHNLCLHFGSNEHPFDVHQGYRVLTHSHISFIGTQLGSRQAASDLPECWLNLHTGPGNLVPCGRLRVRAQWRPLSRGCAWVWSLVFGGQRGGCHWLFCQDIEGFATLARFQRLDGKLTRKGWFSTTMASGVAQGNVHGQGLAAQTLPPLTSPKRSFPKGWFRVGCSTSTVLPFSI